MMRRLLCLLLAGVAILSMAACSKDKKNDEDDDATSDEISTKAQTEETEEPTNVGHEILNIDFINDFDQSAKMDDEQTVYDKDDITITATDLKYNTADGPQILLTVRNKSDNDLLIQNDFTVVNGCMISPDININVPHRKTVKNQLTLPFMNLAMADISTLRSVSFSLRLVDAKSTDVIDTTPTVDLELEDISDNVQLYSENGQKIYEKDGIKIALNGLKNDVLFENEYVLPVMMYNGTDKTISVINSGLCVNGYSFTHTMQTILLPGAHAVNCIQLFDIELDEKGIETIDTVEASFRICDDEDGKEIARTVMTSVKLR